MDKEILTCLTDFESSARTRMSPMAWEYISGGAADEISLKWNREAFDRTRIRPRVLVDVSRIDTRVQLFGIDLAFPILLAPTAYHLLIHPEGELATARGSSAAAAAMVVSTMATSSVEEIAAVTTIPPWFQLYIHPDRSFTRDLVLRAERAGCHALCLTVDTPVAGPRNREARSEFAIPPGTRLPHFDQLGSVEASAGHRSREGEIYTNLFDPSLTWKDIEWLLGTTKLPVLLKGILTSEDADLAVRAGVAGVIVSNHGARNLDTVPATLDALPGVVEIVAGRIPVLMDGGIRRGTDVLKALALGAAAVLIGRPYLYGLASAGAEGVRRVIRILHTELQMAMALTGRPTIASLDRSVIWSE